MQFQCKLCFYVDHHVCGDFEFVLWDQPKTKNLPWAPEGSLDHWFPRHKRTQRINWKTNLWQNFLIWPLPHTKHRFFIWFQKNLWLLLWRLKKGTIWANLIWKIRSCLLWFQTFSNCFKSSSSPQAEVTNCWLRHSNHWTNNCSILSNPLLWLWNKNETTWKIWSIKKSYPYWLSVNWKIWRKITRKVLIETRESNQSTFPTQWRWRNWNNSRFKITQVGINSKVILESDSWTTAKTFEIEHEKDCQVE